MYQGYGQWYLPMILPFFAKMCLYYGSWYLEKMLSSTFTSRSLLLVERYARCWALTLISRMISKLMILGSTYIDLLSTEYGVYFSSWELPVMRM